jgi:hypothetical protein
VTERTRPDREQAHLIVAAVRVLSHRETRPPSSEEVAELLELSPELTRVIVRQLVELGALSEVADAYAARLEVADHQKIEELEVGGGAALKDEMKSFSSRRREKQEELKSKFAEDLQGKQKQRFSKLEEDLKKFRGDKGPTTNMWGEPIEEPEEESKEEP